MSNRGDDYNGREKVSFPDLFPVSLTQSEFPASNDHLHELGTPLGLIVTPFIARRDDQHRLFSERKYC